MRRGPRARLVARALMPYVRTGRGQEEAYQLPGNRCAGCQGMLAAPHISIRFHGCRCTPGERGHHVVRCRECGTAHYDPPCTSNVAPLGTDYFGG